MMRVRQCATLFKRCASTAPVARHEVETCVGEEKIMRLPNGLTVYSMDTSGPVAQLLLAYRAGSRYQQPDESGLTHHLRNATGIDSKKYYGPQMLWQCGNAGINLVSHLTRDLFAVQTSVVREHATYALDLVSELGQPAFKPWDFEDVIGTLEADLAYMRPYDILMDKLHYAAYRTEPLGNGLYASREEIGKHDFRKLSRFAESRLVSGQAVLVGINIGHDIMLNFISKHVRLHDAPGKSGAPSKYFGGEVRCPVFTDLAHVAIAGEGACMQKPEELAAQAVLLAALGQDSSVKYSPCSSGVVSQAVYKASSGFPFGLSAFNEVYSDSGLVGVYLFAEGDKIGPLVHAAIKALKSFTLDENTLRKAKSTALVDSLIRSESSSNVAFDRAAQILATNAVVSSSQFAELISGVTVDQVQKAATRLKSKLSIASYGNIYQTPYLDQL